MSKEIIVESCGGCPCFKIGFCKDEGECLKTDMEIEELDKIHRDCPLRDVASREEAEKIISKVANRELYTWDALNKLGFTEKEGR